MRGDVGAWFVLLWHAALGLVALAADLAGLWPQWLPWELGTLCGFGLSMLGVWIAGR
jgi:hypothetical protein